jgi:Pentapeptide repeats (8 copies)
VRNKERRVDQQHQSRWRTIGRRVLRTSFVLAALVLGLALAYIIYSGYRHGWGWTGLVKDTPYPKRTLWDWLDLLIVPVVLAIGGYWFTLSDSRRTREQADHRREEDVLQAYLDQMWQLLLDKDLRSTSKANSNSEARTAARSEALTAAQVSTLTTLERIHHADKKRLIVITFLWMWQRSLLKRQDTVVILEGANLEGADLHEVDLGGADLKGADLKGANLKGANLKGAKLEGAKLSKSKLSGADLSNAQVSDAQLKQAKSLKGATMPNGQKYKNWLKSKDQEQNKKSDGSS